jgi:predicted amidohydrolase
MNSVQAPPRFSMNAGMKDILNVMSKFLNLGMALDISVRAGKIVWDRNVLTAKKFK